jgi:hypothetical protein
MIGFSKFTSLKILPSTQYSQSTFFSITHFSGPDGLRSIIYYFGGMHSKSKKTKFRAALLGVITMLCTVAFLATLAFVCWQENAGNYDNPLLAVFTGAFTFPVALLCTVVAVKMVGVENCKLAWISMAVYVVVPTVLWVVGVILASV